MWRHCYFLQAFSNVEYFSAAKAAAFQIFKIIDRVPEIDSSSDEGHKPTNIKGNVEFKNVDFCYPSREDVQVCVCILSWELG